MCKTTVQQHQLYGSSLNSGTGISQMLDSACYEVCGNSEKDKDRPEVKDEMW